MKKHVLALLACLLLITAMFAGCGYKKCDICGEKKFCSTKDTILGEIDVCGDCD